ncbi:recombination regulator RecX [Azonexus sp.]|uniref:recombination regulator RecX n=1 Tax=Azonexus sp. TaxID=1872668 RepID=UPI0039E354A9
MRQRALTCLARRDYSRAELHAKLRSDAEDEETLTCLLDRLESEHLLCDQRYANQRINARAARYGDMRLRQELRQRGICESDISAALPEAGDETQRCRTLWEKKFGALPQTQTERAKQLRFLQYRGFSHAAIQAVLRYGEEV